MQLTMTGHFSSGDTALDTDLRQMEIVTLDSGSYLVIGTGPNGGLLCSQLGGPGSLPVEIDRQYFAPGTAADAGIGSVLHCAHIGGSIELIVGGSGNHALFSYGIGEAGQISDLSQAGNLVSQTAGISAVATAETASGAVLYTVDVGTGRLATYTSTAGDQYAASAQEDPETIEPEITGPAQLRTVTLDGQDYLLATDHTTQGVLSFRIDDKTGALQQVGISGAGQGVGISAPTAMETVTAFGQTWVILGSGGSSSISVMRMGRDGSLTPVDHIIDTLATRFDALQSLAIAQSGDRVFVVAGGGDDGLSLFTLLPDGRLLHLQTLVHTTGAGLMNVNQISAAVVGNEIQIFVGSALQGGVSQYAVSLADLGQVMRNEGSSASRLQGGSDADLLVAGHTGTDSLIGGAGDDILVAGGGSVRMTGGEGGDRFVLRDTAGTVTITDFNAGTDRLDMSDFLLLRGTSQLTYRFTASGAELRFRDAVVRVDSASGTPLSVQDIFGSGFDWPDRVLMIASPGTFQNGDGRNSHLIGSDNNDTLLGGSGNDSLLGGAGDDSLDAGIGNDTAWGGAGNDSLLGGDGRDLIGGGDGNDSLDGGAGDDEIWANGGNDLIWGRAGHDILGGSDGNDTLEGGTGNDQVWGGPGNDLVQGGDGNDTLGGREGDDSLDGGAGDDEIWANGGNDTLRGGEGNDTLGGSDGDDEIWGGAGNDVLRGGDGADTFIFSTSNGQDRITDFQPGRDHILLLGPEQSFSDLNIVQDGDDVRISLTTGTLTLENLWSGALDAGDFLFG